MDTHQDPAEMDEEYDDFQDTADVLQDHSCATFEEHQPGDDSSCVYTAAINIEHNLVISGGQDDHARIWQINRKPREDGSGETVNTVQKFEQKFEDTLVSVGWNNKTPSLCSACDMAGNVKVFNVENPEKIKEVFSYEIGQDVEWTSWHPKATWLLVGLGDDGSMYFFYVNKSKNKNNEIPPKIFIGPGYRSTCHQWIDESHIAVGYENGQVNIYQLKVAESPLKKLDCLEQTQFHFECSSMGLSNNGQYLAVGRSDGKVSIVVANSEKIQVLTTLTIDHTDFKEEGMDGEYESQPQSVESVAFQPYSNRTILACACANGTLMIFELSKNQNRWVKQRQMQNPNDVGFTQLKWLSVEGQTDASQGGPRLIATGDIAGVLRIWDAAGGAEIKPEADEDQEKDISQLPEFCLSELGGHEAAIMDLKIFGNLHILTSSEDGTCKLFNLSQN